MSAIPARLVFATRASALARRQTQWVIQSLQALHPGLVCEEKLVHTQGDKLLDRPLPEIGGKGLFTQELEQALLSGEADCAVHSLKDLPIEVPAGLAVGCIPAREDPREVLVSARGYTLDNLPPTAVVGTSSLRRAAQLWLKRPDLRIQPLRGNVDTRLRKALDGQYDAILLAGAGLLRLDLQDHATQWLPAELILPAPGQGALAVQCRLEDEPTRRLLGRLEHAPTRLAVTAERQFLQGLGGGCSAPLAAYGRVSDTTPAKIHLMGRVLSPDGKQVVDVRSEGTDAVRLGLELAQEALGYGAAEMLASGQI